jgi:hypothetical protein
MLRRKKIMRILRQTMELYYSPKAHGGFMHKKSMLDDFKDMGVD